MCPGLFHGPLSLLAACQKYRQNEVVVSDVTTAFSMPEVNHKIEFLWNSFQPWCFQCCLLAKTKFLSHLWVLPFLNDSQSIKKAYKLLLDKTTKRKIFFLAFQRVISIFCHQGNVATTWGLWEVNRKGLGEARHPSLFYSWCEVGDRSTSLSPRLPLPDWRKTAKKSHSSRALETSNQKFPSMRYDLTPEFSRELI